MRPLRQFEGQICPHPSPAVLSVRSVVTTSLLPLPSLSARPRLSAAALRRRREAQSFTLPCARNFEPSPRRRCTAARRAAAAPAIQRTAVPVASNSLPLPLYAAAAARQQMRFARDSNRAFTQRCNCYFIVKFKAASSTRTLSECPCCRATSNEDAPLKLLRGSAPDKSSCEIQAAWSLELFCAATKIGDAPSLSHLLTSPAAAASCAMIDAWPFWAAT